MPTASVGAPPVRDRIVFSPTSCAICVSMSGVTAKPQPEITCAACCTSVPIKPAATVHGEVDARIDDRRGDHRHDGDERFHQHRAVADEDGICCSFSIIFGVVPEAISAWKPDTAPQAMVMNRNGNRLPAQTGPVPSMKLRDRRHLAGPGCTTMMPIASSDDRADLQEGRQVVARRQQQPDRQDGGDEAVADDASAPARRRSRSNTAASAGVSLTLSWP